MGSTLFWDETTKHELLWPEVWAQVVPLTKMGQTLKRDLRPFLPEERILWQTAMSDLKALYTATEDVEWSKQLQDTVRACPDVEGVLQLLSGGASLRQVDFFDLKKFLWQGRAIQRLLLTKGLMFSWWQLVDWDDFIEMLNPPGTLLPTFTLSDLPDTVLRGLQSDLRRVEADIQTVKKEQVERAKHRYGRAPNRDGEYVWDKGERDMLLRAAEDAELQLVQENMFESVYRLLESEEIVALREQREAKVQEIEDQEILLLAKLVRKFRPHVIWMQGSLQAVAQLDLTLAKTSLAQKWSGAGMTFPLWLHGAEEPWTVTEGWHPVARTAVEKRDGAGTYTPLDLTLQAGVGVITGPNMGGKSVVLKTFGLLQALAQHAMPVPAAYFAFHPLERIGLLGGDEQSVEAGLSSFGAEMKRLSGLLNGPGRALLLLDEVARTTNPLEGEALAVGVTTHLLRSGHVALFASHFPGVTCVEGIQGFRVAGLRQEMLIELEQERPDDVLSRLRGAMDYRLVPSEREGVPKHALRLARCFGLPEDLLQVTQEVLDRKEGLGS